MQGERERGKGRKEQREANSSTHLDPPKHKQHRRERGGKRGQEGEEEEREKEVEEGRKAIKKRNIRIEMKWK